MSENVNIDSELVSRILKELMLQQYIHVGNSDGVKSLVNDGADVNWKNCDGTMLIIAAKYSQWHIVELLIDLGADVCQTYQRCHWQILHYAAKKAWLPVIQLFIDKHFDLNVKTANEETPLIIATQWNRKEVVSMLVDAGADMNARDHQKYTALQHATNKGHMELVKYLVRKRADPNIHIQSQNVSTPLHQVLRNRNLDIELIVYFIRAGADCNLADDQGITAFNIFCTNKLLQAIFESIERGGYMSSSDYIKCMAVSSLKNNVLTQKKYCSQSIINEYNNKDLPALYKVQVASNMLPAIKFLKINDTSETVTEIDRVVENYIAKYGYCNLQMVKPLSLSMKSVKAFLEHVEKVRVASNQINSSAVQSGMKSDPSLENPSKKVCIRRF